MRNKKLFWILAILLAWFGRDGARGQQKQPVSSEQEDCGVTFNFATASSGAQAAGTTTAGSTGTTAVIDNRQSACLYWKVAYSPNSATATVSLAFQTATDVAGVPGTWSNYPGTLDSGINPNTAVTTGGARTEASGVEYPFLRMNMTVLTGAGARIQGKLTGWKSRPPITANAVIAPGTICTAGAPCPVDGPTADGAAVAFPPVMIAGQDGTNVQTMLTDTSGRPVVIGSKTNNAAAPGATNIGALGCIANAAAPTWIEGNEVLCSVDLAGNQRITGTVTITPSGTQTVAGNKSNNTAAPGATNIGAIAAIANAAAPSYTEGNLVLHSVNLAGSQRTVLDAETTKVIGTARVLGNAGAAFDAATGAAPPANAVQVAGLNSGATGGLLGGIPVCDTYYNINIVTATTTLAVTGVSGRHVRICHINMVAAGTQNVGIISGTGSTCGTGTGAIVGTTAGTGYNWTAQTGISAGSGIGTIMRTVAAGDSVCIITSAGVQLSGVIAYTIY